MPDLICPSCGSEELDGERQGGVILLTCADCATSWKRDLTPRCPKCGGDDLEAVVKADAGAPAGPGPKVIEVVYLCRRCDAAALDHA